MVKVKGEDMSQAELARALGLSPARITMLKKRGMPVHDVEAAMAWRARNIAVPALTQTSAPASGAAPAAVAGALDLAQERAGLAKAQREGIELKNSILRGEYASIMLLADVLATASQAVAERFDHLAPRLRRACPELPSRALEEVMAVVAAARNEWVRSTAALISKRLDEMPDDGDDDGDADEVAEELP